jgi:hypothetical protein
MNNLNTKTFTKLEKYALAFIGLLLFAYIIARAVYVPVVSDEVFTYFFYIQQHDFVPYQSFWDANNHLVNSALSSLFTSVFGTTELVLRMGNIIFFPLYLYYSYKLAGLLKNKYIQYVLILSLWFAHNFIEYFAYSRGYGMSMAFLIASLYYTALFIDQGNAKSALPAMLFNTLALAANLSLLNVFLLINITALAGAIIHRKKINTIRFGFSFSIVSIAPFIFFMLYLLEFKRRGLLYHGTLRGFVIDTLNSLADLVLSYNKLNFLYALVVAFYLLLGIYIVAKLKHIKKFTITDFFVGMFTGAIALIFLLALVFKVNYPQDRVGLYLVPLAVLAVVFTADNIQYKIKYLIVLPLLFFPVHFVKSINLTHSRHWHAEQIPKRYLDTVLADPGYNGFPPVVGGGNLQMYPWAYYNIRANTMQNEIQETNFRNNFLVDYIIYYKDDISGWENSYNEIDYDSISNLSLFKRKERLDMIKVIRGTTPDVINNKSEFIGIAEVNSDSLAGKKYWVTVSCKLKVLDNKTHHIHLITNIHGVNGYDLGYHNQLEAIYDIKPEYSVNLSFAIPETDKQVNHLGVFFHNVNRNVLQITGINYTIYKVLN